MDKHTSQVDHVTVKLRQLILDMAIKPGEKITERYLEEALGPSRTSVRTALFRLENEGLVSRLARGWQVTPLDLGEIRQLCDYRRALETASLKQASPDVIKERLPEAEEIIKILSKEADHHDAYKAGCAFHNWMAGLSDNIFIMQSVENATLRLRRARFLAGEPDHGGWIGQNDIISALKKGDISQAITLTENQLCRKRDNLLKILSDKKRILSKEGSLLLSIKD